MDCRQRWGTYPGENASIAAVCPERTGAVVVDPAVVTNGVAAQGRMVVSVVPGSNDSTGILHSRDSRGRHGEGEDGDGVEELHFGCWKISTGGPGSDVRGLLCFVGLLVTTSRSQSWRGWRFI